MTGNEYRLPRLLVTGFGPFPGAPVNPTAALVERLQNGPGIPALAEAIHIETLPVSWNDLPDRLARIGTMFAPDIAIHFGLSSKARGFTIERRGLNRKSVSREDAHGNVDPAPTIDPDGPAEVAATLPVSRLLHTLESAGLPAVRSDDAGDYLCNMTLYISAGHRLESLRPSMAGFIHVPPCHPGGGSKRFSPFTEDMLFQGAGGIITECIRVWHESHSPDDPASHPNA